MAATPPSLLDEVAGYYSAKLAEHGATPRGVDWNGAEGQALRFEQLARIVRGDAPFSLNDVGCGYGALVDFLQPRFPRFDYVGCDVSEAMVEEARRQHAGVANARFVVGARPPVSDYSVASGIFNVRLGRSDAEWHAYLEETLEVLDACSTGGFAFNCLTSYSDAERMRPDLYYPDPGRVFDLCKRRFSRNVALLHDYGLYEFTILVRKAR